ncbi:MAG: hypothetical protein ACI4JB_09880 [Porcipelethomonas sp.]
MTAKERYDKAKTKMYAIKVIKTTESDIIEKLESVPNKSGYIKSLIRKDIEEDYNKLGIQERNNKTSKANKLF